MRQVIKRRVDVEDMKDMERLYGLMAKQVHDRVMRLKGSLDFYQEELGLNEEKA